MAVVTTQQKVAALYTAIFNRAPDQAGLNFWTAQINAGTSFASIAAGFAQHEVFTTGIGALDNAGYVSALYTNILGSAGDTAGIAYWTARLAAGESKAAIVAEFVNGSLTIDIPALLASGGISAADAAAATIRQQTLTNKADVGIYFANTLGAASNLNPATVSTSKAGLEADPIYKASQAAIAGVDSTAASVQTAKDAIAVAAGSANPAEALLGHTFTLTAGADTIVGGAANDVINALTVDATGATKSTLTAFDSIDGGAGNDTLNIFTETGGIFGSGAVNTTFPANVTVKNVETINYNNAGNGVIIKASNFVGATAINQIGTGSAGAITELAAGTVAGFNGTTTGILNVTAADTAATAALVLTNVAEGRTVNVGAATAGVLNSVTITGTVADTSKNGVVTNTNVNVTVGKDVESVAVNTAVGTTLTVKNLGGKAVSSVDASASTGAVTYTGAATVANIKTGAGNDTATLATSLNATVKAASISTGAGDDTIKVAAVIGTAAAGQTVAVDAGEGNDTINLNIVAGVGYNVAAGAGDDTVVITGTVKTTDVIDGGAGTDTVSLALAKANTLVADDYIVFNKVLTNFETLQLTSKAATMDASMLDAGYTTIDLATDSIVTNVGTQALVAHGNLTATAKGYVAAAGATPATYVGTLNITDKATGVITANADKVALTVDASANTASVTLAGDAQSASVNLVQALNTAKTNYVGVAAFTLDTSASDASLTSLTLSGNGTAKVTNAVDTKLVSVDASGLNSVTFDGKAAAGLTYSSDNAAAETIKLGAGQDNITLGASTYGKVDVVSGLNLVASAADAKVVDATKSDILHINGVDLTKAGALGFTTTQTDLDLALKDAAAYAHTKATDVAFHMGGNTYVLHDAGTLGGIDAADTVVKISGQVNLDLLASSLVA